jgi:hypothetical protein
MPATGRSTRPITAAEASAHTQAKVLEAMVKAVSYRSAHYPIDSIRAAVAVVGAEWLARLRQQPVKGIQLDPSGRVGVGARQDAYAKAQIATRLATPALPVSDKAHALRTAVEAFGNFYTPERLPVAEAYLKDLDALGDSAATWRFEARKTLLWTYYLLGRSADVVRLGTQAIQIAGIIPFANRNMLYGQVEEQVYSPTVEALTGQPNARAQIDRLNVVLRAGAIPDPALIAFDSVYARLGEMAQGAAEYWIASNAKLGTQAAPLVAHHWLNRPSHDSTTLSLNDGKIRLIEVANTGCAACIHELHALERLSRRFPQIEPMMITWTTGAWGNRLVEPADELRLLTNYFVTDTKITFPVGIWAGKKMPNEDGGMTPEASPNNQNYPPYGKPMLWVVDGAGTIRRAFTGYDREIEMQITRTVEFLIREARVASVSSAERAP